MKRLVLMMVVIASAHWSLAKGGGGKGSVLSIINSPLYAMQLDEVCTTCDSDYVKVTEIFGGSEHNMTGGNHTIRISIFETNRGMIAEGFFYSGGGAAVSAYNLFAAGPQFISGPVEFNKPEKRLMSARFSIPGRNGGSILATYKANVFALGGILVQKPIPEDLLMDMAQYGKQAIGVSFGTTSVNNHGSVSILLYEDLH